MKEDLKQIYDALGRAEEELGSTSFQDKLLDAKRLFALQQIETVSDLLFGKPRPGQPITPCMPEAVALQWMYDSAFSFSIRAFYDRGFTFELGENSSGITASKTARSFAEGVRWLARTAAQKEPNSEFAGLYAKVNELKETPRRRSKPGARKGTSDIARRNSTRHMPVKHSAQRR